MLQTLPLNAELTSDSASYSDVGDQCASTKFTCHTLTGRFCWNNSGVRPSDDSIHARFLRNASQRNVGEGSYGLIKRSLSHARGLLFKVCLIGLLQGRGGVKVSITRVRCRLAVGVGLTSAVVRPSTL